MSAYPYQHTVNFLLEELSRVVNDADKGSLNEEADLLIDLGLDSVQVMQVLVAMETRYGIRVPLSALHRDEVATVARMAEALSAQQPRIQNTDEENSREQNVHNNKPLGEPELDIKVHCLASCLCECFRLNPAIDHRPFYFGVWDAEIFIDEKMQLSYHDPNVDHGFFIRWFERLYNCKIDTWYRHDLSKHENMAIFSQLLNQRRSGEQLLVMLDLYHLPERENRFNQNPFPHYVLLEKTDENENLWMWDPDFRWEGKLNKERVLNAISQPTVAGGYRFFEHDLQAPNAEDIDAYFKACMATNNLLSDACSKIIHWHIAEQRLEKLSAALRELPVLAMRKYAYEHAFAFYWREMQWQESEFEIHCEDIETLVRQFEQLQFHAAMYADLPKENNRLQLMQTLNEQQQRESRIKTALRRCHKQWKWLRGISPHPTDTPLPNEVSA